MGLLGGLEKLIGLHDTDPDERELAETLKTDVLTGTPAERKANVQKVNALFKRLRELSTEEGGE